MVFVYLGDHMANAKHPVAWFATAVSVATQDCLTTEYMPTNGASTESLNNDHVHISLTPRGIF